MGVPIFETYKLSPVIVLEIPKSPILSLPVLVSSIF